MKSIKKNFQSQLDVRWSVAKLNPGGMKLKKIPESPSKGEIEEAKGWVNEILDDFPLVSVSEKAHATGFFLLPFIRDYIRGDTPFHLFEAAASRTGKSLLVQALSYPYLGSKIAAQPEVRSNEELRKQITTSLLDAPAYIFFDNLNDKIDSGLLANVATCGKWKDRLLGSNTSVILEVDCIWVFTANNPKMSSENLGRMIRIRQDAKMEFPGTRDPASFTHPDLMEWVEKNRSELVWSALVLIQNWIAKGKPKPSNVVPMGGFEKWRDCIGGILQSAGIPGFLANEDEFRANSDDETSALRALIFTWFEEFGSEEVTIKELYPMVVREDIELDLTAETEKGGKIKLGNLIKTLKDRRFNIPLTSGELELTVTKGGTVHRATKWKLTAPDDVCVKCGGKDFWKSKKSGKWNCLACVPVDESDIADWKMAELTPGV